MGRSIAGAIVGYITMFFVVFACIGLTWMIVGPEGSFAADGPPDPSMPWNISNVISGFLAAFVGGAVARKIGRSLRTIKILVGIVLVLGIVLALTAESAYESRLAGAGAAADKPAAELSFFEAGKVAKNPTWYDWIIPLIGTAGVVLGGRKPSAAELATE